MPIEHPAPTESTVKNTLVRSDARLKAAAATFMESTTKPGLERLVPGQTPARPCLIPPINMAVFIAIPLAGLSMLRALPRSTAATYAFISPCGMFCGFCAGSSVCARLRLRIFATASLRLFDALSSMPLRRVPVLLRPLLTAVLTSLIALPVFVFTWLNAVPALSMASCPFRTVASRASLSFGPK